MIRGGEGAGAARFGVPFPAFPDFAANYDQSLPQCVALRRIADVETPVLAYLKLRQLAAGEASFLFESVENGAVRGRYSMIGLNPDLVFEWKEHALTLREGGQTRTLTAPPLEALETLLAQNRLEPQPDLPPMASGLFGFMAYDMVRQMERLSPAKPDPLALPDCRFIRPTLLLVFDAVKDEMVAITPVFPKAQVTAQQAYEGALARLDALFAALDQPAPADPACAPHALSLTHHTPPQAFQDKVTRAKEYIASGDIFQVVLAQKFSAPFPLPAFSLYRALRRINPSPYLSYLDFPDFQLVCSSPEVLVGLREADATGAQTLTIRPIAGTRPRGQTPEEDRALEADLLADPKERAEHLMLLDLGRNDVGRAAQIGSVRVTESFVIERYSQVMHIVSNVEGTLTPGKTRIEALEAGFPAGTVSGAPKIRAMEIIDALEDEKRGPYAGMIGYFGANGAMDTCITLRTALVKDGRMIVQAGAGIVADSNPASEQAECENKARALFKAAQAAIDLAASPKRGQ